MPRGEPKLVKKTGELEPFHEQKLRRSLLRSGTPRNWISPIVGAVRERLRPGMPTSEVFRIAHRMLRRERHHAAARYSLKRAIQDLGPGGFPFERFVGELWRHEGFRVATGVLLQGRFVRHEVDVVAERGGAERERLRHRRLAECKFKVQSEGKVDVKVALYVHSRAQDLQVAGFGEFWLITNGRFTQDALAYGSGVGLRLLAWDHPAGDGLRERIDRSGLHPLTVLSSLRRQEVAMLLRRGVVLCSTLRAHAGVVAELGLSARRAAALWQEIEGLCGGGGGGGGGG